MEQSTEAHGCWAGQEIPPAFMEPEGPLLCSQESANRTYPEQFESSPLLLLLL
jgi:hypothetical protein